MNDYYYCRRNCQEEERIRCDYTSCPKDGKGKLMSFTKGWFRKESGTLLWGWGRRGVSLLIDYSCAYSAITVSLCESQTSSAPL